MRRPSTIAILLLGFGSGLARGSERTILPIGGDYARQAVVAACADAKSAACTEAITAELSEAAAGLVRLASHRHPSTVGLARRAADSSFPEMRVAAASALGMLVTESAQTPILAELLDDPVPAVRTAARKALYGSMDQEGRDLAHRAYMFQPKDDESLVADTPVAKETLGVALPADAVYLYFASDPVAGRFAFASNEPLAQLIAALSKRGRGPFTPDEFVNAVEGRKAGDQDDPGTADDSEDDGDFPSAEEVEKAMAMAEAMFAMLEKNPDASPEEQAAAMAKVAGAAQGVDPYLGSSYGELVSFEGAKLFLVELDGGEEIAVAVYREKTIGCTGIAVHRPSLGG